MHIIGINWLIFKISATENVITLVAFQYFWLFKQTKWLVRPQPTAGLLFRFPFTHVGREIKASAVRKVRFHARHISQASDTKYHFEPAQVQFRKSLNDGHSITFCSELGQQRETLGKSCVLEQSLWTSGRRAVVGSRISICFSFLHKLMPPLVQNTLRGIIRRILNNEWKILSSEGVMAYFGILLQLCSLVGVGR
jgi:hypothetical protein